MSEAVRVYIPLDSRDPSTVGYALAYAKKQFEDFPDRFDKILLVTHTQNQLKFTALAEYLGAAATRALLGGRSIGTPAGPMSSVTQLRLPMMASRSIIIAYYADMGLLDKVDALRAAEAIIVVPDTDQSARDWVSRWSPVVHGQPKAAPQVLIGDQVVVNALKSITGMSNIGAGLLHPTDKKFADECFRILRFHNHQAKSGAIESWAIRNGWHPKAADELAGVAERVFALVSKPRLSEIFAADEKYTRWRSGE